MAESPNFSKKEIEQGIDDRRKKISGLRAEIRMADEARQKQILEQVQGLLEQIKKLEKMLKKAK